MFETLFIENNPRLESNQAAIWSEVMGPDMSFDDVLNYARKYIKFCTKSGYTCTVLIVQHHGNIPVQWSIEPTTIMEVDL